MGGPLTHRSSGEKRRRILRPLNSFSADRFPQRSARPEMWSACGGGEEPPQHLIDIPPSYDPQCERLIRPRPRAEGSLRCVVRLQPREKDVLMHVEDGNVRPPPQPTPRGCWRSHCCRRRPQVLLLVARKEGKHWRIGERDSPASPSSRLRPTLPPPVSAAGADRAFASASALVQLTTCGGGAYSVERVRSSSRPEATAQPQSLATHSPAQQSRRRGSPGAAVAEFRARLVAVAPRGSRSAARTRRAPSRRTCPRRRPTVGSV